MTARGSRNNRNEKRLTKEVSKAIIKVLDKGSLGETDLWQKNKREKFCGIGGRNAMQFQPVPV